MPVDLFIDPTSKQCVKVQCRVNTDCCGFSGECPARRRECEAGIEAGCQIFNDICDCPTTDRWDCVDNQCVALTTSSISCTRDAGLPCSLADAGYLLDGWCNGASCVECLESSHCTTKPACVGKLCDCVQEKCTPVCASDLDCTGLSKCQDRKCVDAPCTTNRECIAATANPLSLCNQGKCQIPCVADLDCPADSTSRALSVCVNGYCKDAGCETRDECRILLQRQGASLTNLLDVDCKEKTP
jgi:hypothetical protein